MMLWPKADEYIITCDDNGKMVARYTDPIKQYFATIVDIESDIDLAWQRAFDNVLEGVDEMIIEDVAKLKTIPRQYDYPVRHANANLSAFILHHEYPNSRMVPDLIEAREAFLRLNNVNVKVHEELD